MSKRNGKWYVRTVHGMLAAALIWAPTASSAETWVGVLKQRWVCPGEAPYNEFDRFTLDIQQGGPAVGLLTIVGTDQPIEVVTDWTVSGRWGYFSASFTEPNGGPYVLYGWISGRKMHGYFTAHDYTDACIAFGNVKAVQN